MSAKAGPGLFVDHGTFTTDTASGLDWLDVTASSNMTWTYVDSQLGAGGLFEGWRYATGEEFLNMISHFTNGIYSPGQFGQIDQEIDKIDGLVGLLGSTGTLHQIYWNGVADPKFQYTEGFIADSYGGGRHVAGIYDDDRYGDGNQYDRSKTWGGTLDGNYAAVETGSFLVRGANSVTPVPEPETYAMMLAGLGLVCGIAKRRKKMQ